MYPDSDSKVPCERPCQICPPRCLSHEHGGKHLPSSTYACHGYTYAHHEHAALLTVFSMFPQCDVPVIRCVSTVRFREEVVSGLNDVTRGSNKWW
ncbi:hypothetical protein E2C01_052497 [Portunus trituberculatus]|uniref:Uncharacterized protein n=1 Tax=Portunus trituberculatus TaxID=210409 RepID=A0A5B7GEP5_PORTR|nr:hypothetical protein [Portunus trituberculatus]